MAALRRWVHRGAGAAIASLLFAGTAATTFIAHGNLPATKRFVSDVTTRALASLFSGRVIIHDIDHIDFTGVDVRAAEVVDPWGRRVISVTGLHVKAAIPRILWSLVSAPAGLSLRVDRIDIDDAEVLLDQGPDGKNRIASAFAAPPKPPSTGTPGPAKAPRKVELSLPSITISHLHAFGEPTPGLTLDARAARVPGRVWVSSQRGVEIDVSRFGLSGTVLSPLDPQGTVEYHLRVPLEGGRPPIMWTSFAGRAGGTAVTASARLTGLTLDAWLDAPKVSPEEARAFSPRLSPTEPVTLHVGATGPLTDLALDAHVTTGQGEVLASGNLHTEPFRGDFHAKVRDVNPRSLDARAPDTRVGGGGDVHVELVDKKLVVDVDAISFPVELGGVLLPGANVVARVKDGFVTGTGKVFEPGLPTDVKFSVEPGGILNLEGDVTAESLAAVPRLRGKVQGKGRVTFNGRMDAHGIEVKFDAKATGVGAASARTGGAHAYGRVAGPLDRLYLDAHADLQGVVVSGVGLRQAHLHATGAPKTPHVTAKLSDPRWDELTVGGTLAFGAGVKVSGLTGKLARGNVFADFRASGIDATPGAIAIRGIDVGLAARSGTEGKERVGAGHATGSLIVSNGGLRGDLSGDLDLGKASAIAGLPFDQGTARFAIHMDEGDGRTGSIALDWSSTRVSLVPIDLAGSVRVTIDGGRATGTYQATAKDEARDIASALGTFRGDLAGPLLAPKSWEKASFSAAVTEAAVDVGALLKNKLIATAVAYRMKDFPTVSGVLHVAGTVDRKDGNNLPDVDVTVRSEGLDVAFTGATAKALPPPLRHLQGVDASVTLRATSRDGGDDKTLGLAVRLVDPKSTGAGDVANLYVETRSSARRALEDLRALGGGDERLGAEARGRIAALPLTGRASVSKRDLGAFPEIVRVPGAAGSLFASAVFSGTFGKPALGGVVHVDDLRADVPGLVAKPLSGDLSIRLDGETAAVGLTLATDERRVVDGKAKTRINVVDMITGRAKTGWTSDLDLELSGLALDSLPLLAANGFGGSIHGTVKVVGLHAAPRVDVDLRIEKGSLFGAEVDRFTLGGFLTDGAGVVTAALLQPKRDGEQGKLLVTVLPAVRFKDGLVPTFDDTRGQTIALQTSRFDVEPFSSFAAPFLADLRGVLDGEVTLGLSARKKTGFDTDLWGKLDFSRGVVIIPQLGQTFRGGSFTAEARDGVDGRTVVAVTKLHFLGTSGALSGSAELTFPTSGIPGLLYGDEGLPPAVIDAHAKVDVAKEEKIPVTFEGVPLGDAHGTVEATLRHQKGTTEIWVAVPRLVFDLPESETRGLQKLGELPDVGVMDRRYREGRRREETTRRVIVRVGIADALVDLLEQRPRPSGEVVLRRAGLDVHLAGRPVIELTDTLRMDGNVETLSGRVTALGKPFVVEPGYVHFEGEAIDNPYLGLRAYWDSPDGARITAELDGYLKPQPKLRLRSDPPKGEPEIFGLLLFGRSSSAGTTSQNNAEGVAVGTGVASSVLNTLLDPVEVFGRRIETRVDTTTTRGTSLGVATEIRPRLWAQVDVYTGSQQNRQNADLSALTLDWRFRQDWSLRTTVGDRGSSTVELLWQHRY